MTLNISNFLIYAFLSFYNIQIPILTQPTRVYNCTVNTKVLDEQQKSVLTSGQNKHLKVLQKRHCQSVTETL